MPRYGRLPTIDEVVDLADELINTPEYIDRELHFDEYDAMAQLNWVAPDFDDEDPASIFDISTSNPFEALNGGAAVLAANRPIITFQPLDATLETRQRAEGVEDALSVIISRGGKRNRSSVEMDVAMSSLRYHECVVEVIPIEHQKKMLGFDPDRTRGRGGPFVFNVYNPRDVFVAHDAYGLSHVVTRVKRRAHEVRSFWGTKGDKALEPILESTSKDIRNAFKEVYEWHYWDYEVHAVWLTPARELSAAQLANLGANGRVTIMNPTKHEIPFLPFAYGMGGSELDRAGDARRPLLYAIMKTGSWDAANVFETIAATKIIQNARRPEQEYAGMNAEEGVTEDATLAGGARYLAPGIQGRDLPRPQMDTAFLDYSNRMTDRMSASSLPAVLANGSLPANSVFSTLNLAVKTALTTLVPYKRLSESVYEQICELILLWMSHLEMDYTVYDTASGEPFVLKHDEIPVDQLDIKVEMDQEEPTDFLQRVNAAALLLNSMGVSRSTAMSKAGIPNPSRELDAAFVDAVDQAIQQGEIALIQQRYALQAQAEAQQVIAQVQQQQTPPAPAGPQGPAGAVGPPNPLNPAVGGAPPIQAGAGTFEEATGLTRSAGEV